MWTNKQHVMSRLAERGHRILYVDPLIRVRMLANNVILKHRYSLRRFLTFEKEVQNNLWLFSPVKFLLSERLETWFNLWNTNRLIKKHLTEKPLLWVYDPEFADYVQAIDHRLLIYDCVDDYQNMASERYPRGRDWIVAKEDSMLKKADVVFATSRYLYETRRKKNPNTYYTPNAADFEHNQKALLESTEIPEDVKELTHPLIGFQGNLSSYKFDFDLIEYLLERKPEWSFVFVGPVETAHTLLSLKRRQQVQRITRHTNAYLLGHRPYAELPAYYKAFDVAIMPNSLNEYNRGSFPLKFFEFLGAGLPVVLTDLPALQEFKEENVAYFSSTKEEFIRNIERALERGDKEREKGFELAKEYSWDNKVEKLLDIINTSLSTNETH